MTAKKSKSLLEEVVSGNGISSLRGGMARVKLNCILQLYYHPPSKNAPTIREHVNAFARHSCFRVWNVNTAFGFPPALNNVRFSVILLHYSLFGLPIGLNRLGSIPRGLPRIRHTGESRYPESPTGFRVKHGMTAQKRRRYPAACGGVVHLAIS